MPRKATFGKNQVIEVIKQLQVQGVKSISFPDIIKNITLYIPNHHATTKQIRKALYYYRKLFENAGIKIYAETDQRRTNRRKYIKETLMHFKNDLKKDVISVKELSEYLLKNYNFKFFNTEPHRTNYKLIEYMNEIGIHFNDNKRQIQTLLNMLKKFSESEIVKQYKKENKTFTVPEIQRQMQIQSLKISTASLYNYSQNIVNLGIPLKSNKVLTNIKKYDEKDIVNKLCNYILKKRIKQIYAGRLSGLARDLSLPNLGYKVILKYKDYIQDMFDIEILNVEKKIDKEKLSNTIQDNLKYLNKSKDPAIKYVKKLPIFNDSKENFLILDKLNNQLETYWKQYLEKYIQHISKDRINVKSELINEDKTIRIDTENKKIYFLLHDKLHIKNLSIEDIIKLSQKGVLSQDKIYGIHRQNMFIGFLIFLYSKGLLQIPTLFSYYNYYKDKKAQIEIVLFIEDNNLYKKFKKLENENRLSAKEVKDQRFFFFFLLSLRKDITPQQITDKCFYLIDKIDPKKSKKLKKIFNTMGASLNISSGELIYTKDYYNHMNNNNFKDFIIICNAYMDRKIKLRETKTPKSFQKHTSSKIVKFLDFCDQFHKGLKLNKENLQLIFDFPESKSYTYQEHVDSLKVSNGTKNTMLSIFVEIFANTKGYEGICTREKIPKFNFSSNSSRLPIEDDEIIYKIDDIVTNRPPKSDYFKNYKVSMDMSWWKHIDRVVPFEPLLIKTHLRIPVRGDTLRKIDRDIILQKNNEGAITGFHFISDKNKNRREPFIVPNIWKSELDYLEKLVEYSRAYFPVMKKYKPDDITIKDGILPLFPNKNGTASYPSTQHLKYWSKVLIQAQMEFEQEGKNYTLVYSDDIELPKNMEEFDNLTVAEIETFKRKYDIHSLRHTGITRCIRAGMPLELVRLLSGHSGYNTILTVYYHVNQEEMIQDWINKYDVEIDNELNMHKVSQLFLNTDILSMEVKSSNSEKILKILKENNFFNLQNRNLAFEDHITIETISQTDPKFWKPINGGICTKYPCPKDMLGRCSLCPYYITNYRYIHDIGLNMQMSMARVQKYSDMVLKNRKANKNDKNQKLKKRMNYEIEDFIGWLEVLSLAQDSYNYNKNKDLDQKNALISSNKNNQPIFEITRAINIDHGYLEILSQAFKKKIYDNETVADITNIIANKLIRYHAKNGNYDEIEQMDNESIVKSFLPQYEKYSNSWFEDPDSYGQLINLLTLLNDNKRPELINEDTFLTK